VVPNIFHHHLNPPTATFVRKENILVTILFKKKFRAGFKVLYEPMGEGVRSPWYTNTPAFTPHSNFEKWDWLTANKRTPKHKQSKAHFTMMA